MQNLLKSKSDCDLEDRIWKKWAAVGGCPYLLQRVRFGTSLSAARRRRGEHLCNSCGGRAHPHCGVPFTRARRRAAACVQYSLPHHVRRTLARATARRQHRRRRRRALAARAGAQAARRRQHTTAPRGMPLFHLTLRYTAGKSELHNKSHFLKACMWNTDFMRVTFTRM